MAGRTLGENNRRDVAIESWRSLSPQLANSVVRRVAASAAPDKRHERRAEQADVLQAKGRGEEGGASLFQVRNRAADGLGVRFGNGLAGESCRDRVGKIAFDSSRARFSQFDVAIVDAAAVRHLSVRIEKHRFRSDRRSRRGNERVLRVAESRAGVLVFLEVIANGVGPLPRIDINQNELHAAWAIGLVELPNIGSVAIGDRAIRACENNDGDRVVEDLSEAVRMAVEIDEADACGVDGRGHLR